MNNKKKTILSAILMTTLLASAGAVQAKQKLDSATSFNVDSSYMQRTYMKYQQNMSNDDVTYKWKRHFTSSNKNGDLGRHYFPKEATKVRVNFDVNGNSTTKVFDPITNNPLAIFSDFKIFESNNTNCRLQGNWYALDVDRGARWLKDYGFNLRSYEHNDIHKTFACKVIAKTDYVEGKSCTFKHKVASKHRTKEGCRLSDNGTQIFQNIQIKIRSIDIRVPI